MKQITQLLMSAACIALCVTLYSCNNAFHEATGATSSGGGGKPTGTGEPAPPPPAGPVTLQSIAVTSPPSRNRFFVGEILDTVTLAGIVVTGTYSDSSTANVTSQASFSVPPGGTDRTETVTVTVGVKTAPFTITLYELPKTIYIGDPNSGGAGYTTLNEAISAATDNAIITLYDDMQISNDTGLNNKTLTISGYGTTAKKITHNAQGKMFDLGGSDHLILAGMISLDGSTVTPHNGSNPLVRIAGTAALEMNDSATITGNIGFSSGGGVSISGSGSLIMNGEARISGNETGDAGGGVYMNGGSLTMNDSAQISNNQAASNKGGGVHIESGSLIMNDSAQISSNQAARYGGGVYLDGGSLTMNDNARISNNSANNHRGGGVFIISGSCIVADALWNSRIYSNNAGGNGKQVYKDSGSFTDSSGTVGSPTGNDGSDYWD